ncbi:DUF6701 domain-containing protein [Vibrio parahaemolyticus]|uniref:DUF6701 domain-containing protein n=1 Tax=Vibrio parahaemolyticus TaxID=670 RepID=UPI000A36326E|nr:DUF6701 domain-containing protein [Vibrio parahaemolyticus]OUJ60666.1 hypothetical protein BTO03_11610 [Vibrio parahaemolyticus]TOA36573.1 hypothetical protein CGK28_15645 [Vibrio parahaemolyticus]HAS6971791.1 hypothetical protein [Vibrio parahaemolyticus]
MNTRILIIISGLLFFSGNALATVYDLTPWYSWKGKVYAKNSPCPEKGSYNYSLTTYTCSKGFSLNQGDRIVTNDQTRTLRLKKSVSFGGHNIIGSPSNSLSLDLNGNSFAASNLTLNGHIDNGNYIELSNSTVLGMVRSTNDGVKLTNVDVGQNVIAKNYVDVSNGAIHGYLDSSHSGIRINNAFVGSYLNAKQQIEAFNSSVNGSITSSNGGVDIDASGSTSAKSVSGHITAKGAVTVNHYQVSQQISSDGYIELTNTKVVSYVSTNSNSSPAVVIQQGSDVSGSIISKGYIKVSHSSVSGNVDNTQGSNQGILVESSQIDGDVLAKGYVDVQNSFVDGEVISSISGGRINSSRVKSNVKVKDYLDVVSNSYVCGTASSENNGANISNAYIGDDVNTKKYLNVTNSTVFGTAGVLNAGMALSAAKILSDSKAIKFPSNNFISISNNSVLCGTANSSYSYSDKLVAYCGLNDSDCNVHQSKGACPVALVGGPEYNNFYTYCGITPPEPEPKKCEQLPPENFDNGSLANWSVMGFKSSDGEISKNPQAIGTRFRLNANIQNQATASAYNYVFPSAQNYLQVEFDHYAHSGSGGDGIALVLSDAKVPPQTGAFGGPLGYGMKRKINHPEEHLREDVEGFAGGWLGVGFDEYGNYYRTGGETILQDQTLKPNVVGIRGEGALDANGKWLNGYEFIKGYGLKEDEQPAEDIDGLNRERHSYRIILNSRKAGKYYLSVERKIGSQQWKTLIEKFDVYQQGNFNTVPENFRLSVTASTGWATNTHEIDNFQVCADKFSRLTDGIHHFEFDYSGSGSTCQASQVELRACMNTDCSKRYPRDVYNNGVLKPLNVTLTPPVGHAIANWVDGIHVTLENQKELALQASESGTITMGVASSSVPQFGFEGARCRINGGPLSAENCDVTFAKNVLAVNVADVVANQQSQSENHLSFCSSKADADGEWRNVNMSMEYEVAPVDKTQSVSIWYKKVDNNAVEWTSEPTLLKTKSTVLNHVYFDSQGKAYFKIKYPEAGRVRLNASVDGVSDSAGFASFVSFPKYLKLTATKADKNGACTEPDDGCSNSFIAAGEEFDMTITAYQAVDGAEEKVAKNYQEPAITITNNVEYPKKDGASSATLLNTSLPGGSKWANGKVMLPQSVSEVGAFEFSVAAPVASDENGKPLATSSYLGSSTFKIQDAVATIGRFYPAYFNVTETNWDYPDNQGESAYMGQAFDSVSFAVTAYNASGGATQNYGLFASGLKADFYLSGEHSDRLNIANKDLGAKNWSGAVWRKQWNNSVQWSKPISPDGPFNSKVVADTSTSTSIGLSLSNSGGKTSSYIDPTLFRFKSSIDGKEQLTTSVAQVLLAQPDVRFGRIDLDDVGGNQGSTLHVPLRVEYWNGSRFIANPNDNQTEVTGVKAAQQHIWPTDQSAKDVTLGEGGIVTSGSSRSVTATQAEPYRQQTRVWLDLDDSTNGLPWLKYNWDNKNAGEENPSSVVTFGIHRGNDRVIYRGEPGLTGQ